MTHAHRICMTLLTISSFTIALAAAGCAHDQKYDSDAVSLDQSQQTAATGGEATPQASAANMDAQTRDVVDAIGRREDAIRDIRMRCRVYSPHQAPPDADTILVSDFRWGFSDGKEYMAGERHDPSRPGAPPTVFTTAYDGQQMVYFEFVHRHVNGAFAGVKPQARITAYDAGTFRSNETPATLLGMSLKRNGHESLSDILRQSRSVRIQPNVLTLDGVVVLDVDEIYLSHGNTYDARLWIDTKRGYSVVRADMFMHIIDPAAAPQLNFKNPVYSVHGIQLQQFGKHWIPVEGWRTTYSQRPAKPIDRQAMQQADMSEAQWLAKHGIASTPTLPRHIVIDPATVQINEGIPIKDFQVDFPKGTRVFNELHGNATYTVGE